MFVVNPEKLQAVLEREEGAALSQFSGLGVELSGTVRVGSVRLGII